MKFLNYLQEEYCELYKFGLTKTEVYVNPSKDDIKTLIKASKYITKLDIFGLRFTADSRSKKLFVWDASVCNHNTMIEYLIKRKQIKPASHKQYVQYADVFLNGFAGGDDSGILKMADMDELFFIGPDKLAAKFSHDWSWLKPYFNSISKINNLKKRYIKEEYITTLRSQNDPYTVYKNPTLSDFKELEKEIRKGGDDELNVRAIVDLQNEVLYVWDANRALHYKVMHELVKEFSVSTDTIEVLSTLKNGKIKMSKIVRLYTKEHKWMKEYFI